MINNVEYFELKVLNQTRLMKKTLSLGRKSDLMPFCKTWYFSGVIASKMMNSRRVIRILSISLFVFLIYIIILSCNENTPWLHCCNDECCKLMKLVKSVFKVKQPLVIIYVLQAALLFSLLIILVISVFTCLTFGFFFLMEESALKLLYSFGSQHVVVIDKSNINKMLQFSELDQGCSAYHLVWFLQHCHWSLHPLLFKYNFLSTLISPFASR